MGYDIIPVLRFRHPISGVAPMTENLAPVTGADTAAPVGAQFTVEKIYVKDVSFEAPNAPQVFNENGQPQLNMNLNQKVGRLEGDLFEVVLGITLTCTVNERTVYLAEVEQAGIFGLGGFPPFYMQPINFEALYAEGLRRRAEAAAGSGASVTMQDGGNA